MSAVIEEERVLQSPGGEVPALVCSPEGRSRAPAVLFYHGLRANKEMQRKEGRALARVGLVAVLVDAPHHGARASTRVAPGGDVNGLELDRWMIGLVQEGAAEVPSLVDQLLASGHPRVGIAGISMGAYIALAAAVAEPRLAATVSLLGSPDWTPEGGVVPPDLAAAVAADPLRMHARLVPRPLLLLNGGRDVNVRPEGARRLVELLRPLYAGVGAQEQLVHREYPDADHFPGEHDWSDLWAMTLAFLTRALRPDAGE